MRVIDRLGRDEANEAARQRRTRVSDRLERDEADEAVGRSRMRLNSFRTRLNAHLNIQNPLLCNPHDSWCRVFEENTDAEGDRLLVKDPQGGTNVIGWNKIAVVFGAKHNNSEDFRSIKVMHTTLDKYNPWAYLPALVEHNPNKKLVNGQPYEEVLYYKDAAPYGPMNCLMTTVAELFWSAGRAMGRPWAVSTRRPHAEDKQLEEFVPASSEQPVSSQRPEDIPIASPEQPVSSKKPHAEDKERGLVSKKKNKLPSTERQSAKELSAAIRRDISQMINSRLLPYVQARIQRHIMAIDTWKQAYEVELSKRRKRLPEETHLQKLALVQTQLEETKRSSKASIKRLEEEASRLREALAAKESAVQALENAHQKEISTLKATCRKYKTSLDGEIGTNADLQARVLNLQDELSTCKYTQEQALQGQKSAWAELLEVKKELRMLQVLHQDVDEGNAASAP
ncbi:hypothetical protein R1flu_024141 [Riccia fluitans]|uniref:Uncharacterized protein n=1 Tax=Riccia fluitans TaxID=41844 RepID=A0ABD1XUH3_9MARC